jgi:hypothetical protein
MNQRFTMFPSYVIYIFLLFAHLGFVQSLTVKESEHEALGLTRLRNCAKHGEHVVLGLIY